ncbi:hypothetical protein DP43_5188 [Burkholderia pseudomallei]|nr:hypothetical protein DP43_5188 [Burkholderia pseudomallei]
MPRCSVSSGNSTVRVWIWPSQFGKSATAISCDSARVASSTKKRPAYARYVRPACAYSAGVPRTDRRRRTARVRAPAIARTYSRRPYRQ